VVNTRFEITLAHPALKAGAFDVQQTAAVQAVKFVRQLGTLNAEQMAVVEQALAQVLGLKLAQASAQPESNPYCSGRRKDCRHTSHEKA